MAKVLLAPKASRTDALQHSNKVVVAAKAALDETCLNLRDLFSQLDELQVPTEKQQTDSWLILVLVFSTAQGLPSFWVALVFVHAALWKFATRQSFSRTC